MLRWWGHIVTFVVMVVAADAQSLQFIDGGDMADFFIREDTPVGTVVYTLRGRDSLGRPVTYSASGDVLSVNPNTGAVTLVLPLDRETSDVIDTIITVSVEMPDGQPTIVPLRRRIPVQDVNDNSPLFSAGTYIFEVDETASPGATLFSDITVTDLDDGPNANLTVSCDIRKSEEACSTFDVRTAYVGGSFMAVITLRKPLDYEATPTYDIVLVAHDGGPDGGLSSTATVKVKVKDKQDEAPIFLNSPYSATVREGQEKTRKLIEGTKVLTLRVRDGDASHPRPLALTLEGDSKGYFALQEDLMDDDGTVTAFIVTTNNLLDREDSEVMNNGGLYTFNVKAQEIGGGSDDFTRAPVTIVVTDADDQMPVFSSPEVAVTVNEDLANGTPLSGLDLVVSDGDLSDNAKFDLTLEEISPEGSEGVFSVFPKTVIGRSPVILKVADTSRIDFENSEANHFIVKVIAVQNGTPVSSSIVNITVTDTNDNPPVFESPSYRTSISENAAPGTSVTKITAIDYDSGNFAIISYSMKGFGSEKFKVDSLSGEVFLGTCGGRDHCLDYEQQASYSLTYLATDGGGKVASVNLFVDVLDENDNAPAFSDFVYRRTVDEGATEFLPPLIVEATDADGEQQGGGKVTYSIQEGNTDDNAFRLEPFTGELSITRPLTYLDTPASSYTITVRASDAGTPPRFSDVRVIIKVGRQTNKSPRFLHKTYTAEIPETSKPGAVVETLEAMDPDGDASVGDIALYKLGTGAGDTFEIESSTGLVRLAKMAVLDRDETSVYRIQVLAVDRDKVAPLTATTTLTVYVTDVNNKPPVFKKKTYTAHVSERQPPDSEVLRVEASDPDDSADLRYELAGAVLARDRTGIALTPNSPYDFAKAFRIDSKSGEVLVSGVLDHNEAAVMVLPVRVVDVNSSDTTQNQNDTAEVTIYIEAFSDKNPIFGAPWSPSHPFLELELKEERTLGQPVFAVTARDPVSGQSVRRYEKVPGSDPDDVFAVAPITGQVSLNKRMDYEASDTKTASLRVKAVAGERSSEATVTVKLLDINDNSPQFTEEEYHARISEDSKWPSFVVNVTASDADTGDFGTVRYSLGGEASMLFVINDTTGEITIARGARLDREQQPVLSLEATATDTPGGGLTSRWSSVKVIVELIDVNDEAPVWSEPGYTAVVAENAPIGTPITNVLATDPDAGLNGLVRYSLPENQVPLDALFTLDPESGVLTVAAQLRGKGRGEPYELTVRAMDQGTPQQRFSEAIIKLYIGDVSSNDGVPEFVRPRPNEVATIIENSLIGTAVFQVVATDPDDQNSPNGKLLYSFLDNTANNDLFAIDSESGIVSTRALLDREQQEQYNVVVVAQDLGRPPQLTSRLLTINVTDIDDNDPVFQKALGILELDLEEEAASGTVVGEVAAIDRDVGDNALIDYAITYGNDEGLLELRRTENNTAQLLVRRRVDRENIASLTLTIACGRLGSRLPSRLPYSEDDPSLQKVVINILDLDDNKPRFFSEHFTAGVRIDAPLQTEVITVKAEDLDPTSPPIRYSLENITFEHSSLRYTLPPFDFVDASGAFLLEENTGKILTHELLARYSHGSFNLLVAAFSDPTQDPAYTTVKIMVVRDADLLRFVFDVPPGEVRSKLSNFKDQVEESLPVLAHLAIYDAIYYTDANGATDFSKTGSCFQLVDRSTEDAQVLLNSEENPRLRKIFEEFDVSGVDRCVSQRLRRASSIDWVEVWVLVLAALIGVGAAIAACTVCCLYSRYKKKVKRQQPHLRLIDSPLPGPGGPVGPGSLIMLPAGPVMGPMATSSVPPSESGRAYEWQERGIPIDSVSFCSVQR